MILLDGPEILTAAITSPSPLKIGAAMQQEQKNYEAVDKYFEFCEERGLFEKVKICQAMFHLMRLLRRRSLLLQRLNLLIQDIRILSLNWLMSSLIIFQLRDL